MFQISNIHLLVKKYLFIKDIIILSRTPFAWQANRWWSP